MIAKPDPSFGIDLDALEKECSRGVDYCVLSYTSNITGVSLPVKEISDIVHRYGGELIIDGAQAAGHRQISLKEEGIDYFAASCHKGLLGPMGTGIIILPENSFILPLRKGGTGIHSESPEMPDEFPYRLESGTLNVPGIYGLIAGVEWVESYGTSEIHKKEIDFTNRCIDAFKDDDNIEIYSIINSSQLFSFNIKGKDSQSVAAALDQGYGIAVRGGLHCAPMAHKALGTFPEGTVRASFSVFTTEEETDIFIKAVKEIAGA